jgi:hypothetical protein
MRESTTGFSPARRALHVVLNASQLTDARQIRDARSATGYRGVEAALGTRLASIRLREP